MARWDSPFLLATAGTLAVHLLLLTALDVIAVEVRRAPPPPAPRIELVDVELPPPPPPVAAAPTAPPAAVPPPPPTAPRPAPRLAATQPSHEAAHPSSHAPTAPPTTAPTAPPTTAPPTPGAGGAPVAQLDDIAPAAHGVPVAHGPATDRVGRGGTGAGTGTGAGSGSADGAAGAPMSVATIKTRAMPRGDFSYLGAGKDYPAEARAAGISGQLRVRLLVDARGRVATATPLGKPLGYGLDEFALRQARLIEFEPARDTADQPVASIVVWTFHMELPR